MEKVNIVCNGTCKKSVRTSEKDGKISGDEEWYSKKIRRHSAMLGTSQADHFPNKHGYCFSANRTNTVPCTNRLVLKATDGYTVQNKCYPEKCHGSSEKCRKSNSFTMRGQEFRELPDANKTNIRRAFSAPPKSNNENHFPHHVKNCHGNEERQNCGDKEMLLSEVEHLKRTCWNLKNEIDHLKSSNDIYKKRLEEESRSRIQIKDELNRIRNVLSLNKCSEENNKPKSLNKEEIDCIDNPKSMNIADYCRSKQNNILKKMITMNSKENMNRNDNRKEKENENTKQLLQECKDSKIGFTLYDTKHIDDFDNTLCESYNFVQYKECSNNENESTMKHCNNKMYEDKKTLKYHDISSWLDNSPVDDDYDYCLSLDVIPR